MIHIGGNLTCLHHLGVYMSCSCFSLHFDTVPREQRRSPTYDAYPRSRRSIMNLRPLIVISLDCIITVEAHKITFLNRSRSNSRSYSPSYAKRHDRDLHADNGHKSKSKAPKIEYITEFGGSKLDGQRQEGISPPSSPPFHADMVNRSGHSTFYTAMIDLTFSSLLQIVLMVLVTYGRIFGFVIR